MMVGGPGYGHTHARDPAITYIRRHESAASLLDAVEKRTQRTYRYGIGLVCIGATLNWLGFAQGNSYVDPLRYLGVASVISGSFCVCLAMCRWLGRPISMSGHLSSFEEDSMSSRTGDVHIINVAVPMFVSREDFHRPSFSAKPPDYDVVAGDPPNYDEAIKLNPGTLIEMEMTYTPPPPMSRGPSSPSHSPELTGEHTNSLCPLLGNENDSRKSSETPPPPYQGSEEELTERLNMSKYESSIISTMNEANSRRDNQHSLSEDCHEEDEKISEEELALLLVPGGDDGGSPRNGDSTNTRNNFCPGYVTIQVPSDSEPVVRDGL